MFYCKKIILYICVAVFLADKTKPNNMFFRTFIFFKSFIFKIDHNLNGIMVRAYYANRKSKIWFEKSLANVENLILEKVGIKLLDIRLEDHYIKKGVSNFFCLFVCQHAWDSEKKGIITIFYLKNRYRKKGKLRKLNHK